MAIWLESVWRNSGPLSGAVNRYASSMDAGLSGSRVLVTGGAGGIGAAVVRAFAAEGASVAVHDNSSREPAEALATEVGGVALGADLTIEEEAAELIPAAVAGLGGLDVCVANAGAYPADPMPLWELSLARWRPAVVITASRHSGRDFVIGAQGTSPPGLEVMIEAAA